MTAGGTEPVNLDINCDSTQTVTLIVTGGAGGPTEPPVVTEITISPAAVGFETQLVATFTDADSEIHTATVEWGDGAISGENGVPEAVVADGYVYASHVYTAADSAYLVTVTVTDDSEASGSSTAFAAVYEPTNGVAAGAGWFAEAQAPRGKAFFGFVCRSVWWSGSPWGQTRLRVGDMVFRSTGYDWLSVAEDGSAAWFAGSGTVNGEGDYYFMVEAGEDAVWITIFDEYDAGGLVPLGGGRIKIRSSN